jgi:hypothetical protein
MVREAVDCGIKVSVAGIFRETAITSSYSVKADTTIPKPAWVLGRINEPDAFPDSP